MRTLAAWLALCVLAVAVLPQGLSGEAASADERRKVTADASGSEAQIALTKDQRELEDRVAVRFSTTDGVLEVQYSNEIESSGVRYEKNLTTQLHELVEYTDENENARYDRGEPIASAWLLSAQAERHVEAPTNGTVVWQPLEASDVESNGKEGKRITARGQLASAGALPLPPLPVAPGTVREVEIALTAFGDTVNYQGTDLGPTEVKVDVRIANYPFERERTRLALVMETFAKDELRDVPKTDSGREAALHSTASLGDRRVTLEFAWMVDVDVDGRDRPLQANELEREETNKQDPTGTHREVRKVFAFEYERGDEIAHDPSVGVDYEVQRAKAAGAGDGDGKIPALGLWAVLVAVGAAVFVFAGGRRP